MIVATAWEQTPYFDPTNPNQITREAMVGTGGDRGYASFNYNQVQPSFDLQVLSPSGSMNGAGLGMSTRTKVGLGVGAVLLGLAGGFFLVRSERKRGR